MRNTTRDRLALVEDSIWADVEDFISTWLLPAGDAGTIKGDLSAGTTGVGEPDGGKAFSSRNDFYMACDAKFFVEGWDIDLNVGGSVGDGGCSSGC